MTATTQRPLPSNNKGAKPSKARATIMSRGAPHFSIAATSGSRPASCQSPRALANSAAEPEDTPAHCMVGT
ncbi:MAG: hypothetical protein K9G04_05380 [Ilumatobacteraceae bacterium]|nr:hypothetical protein [Ilumatobacteraceae bacterium]